MQMVFPRAAAAATTGRPRSLTRRGAFALERVEALPHLAERIGRLAERALEPNLFFLAEFLQPALLALGSNDVRLATFSDREDLRFFAPVRVRGGKILGRPGLSVWTHPYAPLGSPLIDGDMADQVAAALMSYLRTSGRTLFSVSELPLRGPAASALRIAAQHRGFWTEAGHQTRPILIPGANAPGAFDQMVPQKRRRELERQLRKLSEAGAVSHMSARSGADIEAAFAIFIALEASGWKGRRGTALQATGAVLEFARGAVMQLAHQGRAGIDVLRVGERPVAALIRLDHAGLSIPWKIAYDEEFAIFSPGKQLICDQTRRWLGDTATRRVDPVCEENNPLLTNLWPGREPYGTLLVSSSRPGFAARLEARMIDMRRAAKRQAKALLQQRGRPARASSPNAKLPVRPQR
jgi:hypothetical protein